MKKRVKQILAREFLFLTFLVVSSIVFFLFTFPYKYSYNNKIDANIEAITCTKHSLDSLYRELEEEPKIKIVRASDNTVKKRPPLDFSGIKPIDAVKKEDLTELKAIVQRMINSGESESNIALVIRNYKPKFDPNKPFEKVEERKPLNLEGAQAILNSDKARRVLVSQKINKLTIVLEKLRNNKKEKMTFEDQVDRTFIFLILLSIPLFLVRYFYYGINWSMKTLKENR